MKIIILAAGYATRLYPKTLYIPKALLLYNDKPILAYILDDVAHLNEEIIIVTNAKFYEVFKSYLKTRKERITLIHDGSTENENRLGAGNDLIYTLNTLQIEEECLVLASDNIIEFPLDLFVQFYREKGISSLMYYEEEDEKKLSHTGQIEIEGDNVLLFKEKPLNYISHYGVPPFYIFNEEVVKKIKNLNDVSYDSPGSLVESISKEHPFRAYRMPGLRIDLGNVFK